MKFVKMFCSIYTTIVLLAIYAILCATATGTYFFLDREIK